MLVTKQTLELASYIPCYSAMNKLAIQIGRLLLALRALLPAGQHSSSISSMQKCNSVECPSTIIIIATPVRQQLCSIIPGQKYHAMTSYTHVVVLFGRERGGITTFRD